MAVAAAALMPWIAFLTTSLPMTHEARHWRITWVGFDGALAATFLAAALAGRRRSASFPDLLIAAGVLLMCDAWFDLITASTTHELIVSAVEALSVEVPTGLACFALAGRWRSQTRPRLLLRASGARDQLDGSLASTPVGVIAAPAPADADACA